MKLAYCLKCYDVFKLITDVRSCRCGESSGVLKQDKITVQVNGPLKVLGIEESSFYKAINNQPYKGSGVEFKAFVLPKVNKSVIKIKTNKPTVILKEIKNDY
jgi:hypothetical protein